ncbi:MAG: hypothetical protein Q8P95_05555 [bacterium]|nr:hypothetical protein [bacterium]
MSTPEGAYDDDKAKGRASAEPLDPAPVPLPELAPEELRSAYEKALALIDRAFALIPPQYASRQIDVTIPSYPRWDNGADEHRPQPIDGGIIIRPRQDGARVLQLSAKAYVTSDDVAFLGVTSVGVIHFIGFDGHGGAGYKVFIDAGGKMITAEDGYQEPLTATEIKQHLGVMLENVSGAIADAELQVASPEARIAGSLRSDLREKDERREAIPAERTTIVAEIVRLQAQLPLLDAENAGLSAELVEAGVSLEDLDAK